MPTDHFSHIRKKHKLVFEFRYTPVVQAFDRRGKIIETIHPLFEKKIPHWNTQNVKVQFVNNNQGPPTKSIAVDHLRASLSYEDCDSLDEFYNDVRKFIKGLYSVFPEGFETIIRLGVRFLSIHQIDKKGKKEDIASRIQEAYLNKEFPLSLSTQDISLYFAHKTGKFHFGVVTRDEDWVNGNFNAPTEKTPDFGLAVDVDSFAKGINARDEAKLLSAFASVFNLTLTTEKEVLDSLL